MKLLERKMHSEQDSDEPLAMQTDDPLAVKDLNAALNFTYHIIDTHFSTFSYTDTKLQALLTISSLFLAGGTFVMRSFDIQSGAPLILGVIAAALLIVSIMLCVWHVTPKMNSGIGNEINPRSAIGTSNRSKEEYQKIIFGLTKEEMLQHNCNQISGLSRINTQGAAVLKASSSAIGLAVVLFVASFAITGLPEKVEDTQKAPVSLITINIDGN
ncbi:hypothetical protein [Roseovarius ramblicola]|uniref:Pycsar effector protein domain-containing protein n=1 Tax=Roseovarius ramblicola TaxID=2022336 RepID=A0ABV5HYK4_9RHOB